MSLLRQQQYQRCNTYVNQLIERYSGDQTRFGPSFVTTFPFDGTLHEMCYVMQQMNHYGTDRRTKQPLLKISMANSYQNPNVPLIIVGIMHVSRLYY